VDDESGESIQEEVPVIGTSELESRRVVSGMRLTINVTIRRQQNGLPKTVTRQHRDCDLNAGPSTHESSTLTTRLPSHPAVM